MDHNFFVVFMRNWTLYEILYLIKSKLLLLIIFKKQEASSIL